MSIKDQRIKPLRYTANIGQYRDVEKCFLNGTLTFTDPFKNCLLFKIDFNSIFVNYVVFVYFFYFETVTNKLNDLKVLTIL